MLNCVFPKATLSYSRTWLRIREPCHDRYLGLYADINYILALSLLTPLTKSNVIEDLPLSKPLPRQIL